MSIRKHVSRMTTIAVAIAASGTFLATGASAALASPAAPATTYTEYVLTDESGQVLTDVDGLTVWSPSSGLDTAFEFRNPSTYNGKDVYELYDPLTNKCVAWLGSEANLFGESGCVTADHSEDFWYNAINNPNYTKMFNVEATVYYGDNRCLSALGVGDESGVAAYKCSDGSAQQYWTRTYAGQS